MTERLMAIIERYRVLGESLGSAESMADMNAWRETVKEHAQLAPIAQKCEEYFAVLKQIEECRLMAHDDEQDIRDMAQSEIEALGEQFAALDQEIHVLLLPKDPNEDRNVVVEIRAGTGGEEAALFGANLYRMYARYAERHGFGMEPMSENMTELGGVKEVVFVVSGKGAYGRLRFESGVHRVQRVPETESGGRIHTSAATVAVLPEAEDVEVEINAADIRVDVFRSGGHGGQSVNTTDSAVRITHLPTGLVVTCQDEKSQLKNKDKAMRVLKSRLLELMQQQHDDALSKNRRAQVGSGDRSERIRTYNFPQGRITDHRINLTLYRLDGFLDGDMDELIDALILSERAQLLAGETKS
jgi:peptide chain release factor 1